jgi:hypothetical protein
MKQLDKALGELKGILVAQARPVPPSSVEVLGVQLLEAGALVMYAEMKSAFPGRRHHRQPGLRFLPRRVPLREARVEGSNGGR